MALISMIGKVASTSVRGKASKLTSYCCDPVAKDASEVLSKLSKWADTFDSKGKAKELLKQYDKYGISHGEAKKILKGFEELPKELLEVLGDEKFFKAILKRKDVVAQGGLLRNVTSKNKKAFIKVLNDKNITDEQFSNIMGLISDENLPVLKKLLKDKNFDSTILKDIPRTHFSKGNVELIKKIAQRGDVSQQEMLYLLVFTKNGNSDIAIKLLDKAGKNTEGLNTILSCVRSDIVPVASEEVKKLEIQKKLLNELLDCPQFKLGETALDNFRFSTVLGAVRPENAEIAKQALLKGNIKWDDLSSLITQVTPENKKVIEEVAALATKDAEIPQCLRWVNPESAMKYLEEIKKIDNPQIRSQYLEVMENLRTDKLDEILSLIRISKPQDAKQTADVIRVLNNGAIDNIDEVKAFLKMFEQSGRNISSSDLGNISVLCSDKGAKPFLEQLLKTKSVSNHNLNSFMETYLGLAKNFKEQGKEAGVLTEIFKKLSQNKNLSERELEDLFRSITTDNFAFVEKYALNPEIKNMNTRLMRNLADTKHVEMIAQAGIPKEHQAGMLLCMQGVKPEVIAKRLEAAQQLLKNNRCISTPNLNSIVHSIDSTNLKYLDDVLKRKNLSYGEMGSILEQLKSGNAEEMAKVLRDTNLNDKYASVILSQEQVFKLYQKEPELVKKSLDLGVPLDYFDSSSFSNVSVADLLGSKNLEKMLKDVEHAQLKYNLQPNSHSAMFWDFGEGSANDMFVTLSGKGTNGSTLYKFDRKTSKLVSVEHNGKVFNLANNTAVKDQVDYETVLLTNPNTGEVACKKIPYLIQTTKQGKNGKNLGMMYSESPIKGQYEIFATKPDGSRVRIGSAQITPNGAKHIKRTLPAADGSKSSLAYREDEAGNSYLHSIIKDETGKQISEVKRTFKVLADNHFISTHNGQSYDILFSNDKVAVTMLDNAGKKTKKAVEFAIKDIPVNTADEILEKIRPFGEDEIHKVAEVFKQYGIEPGVIDRSCVDMLKRLPGDEWFAMSKSARFVMPQSTIPHNASYAGDSIFMSKELKENLGVYAHELGHAKFHTLNLAKDKKLLEIYNKEKEAYTAAFPTSRVKSIDYFLAKNDVNLRGLNEATAETNLVTDTIQTWEMIQDRTVFYEQFFPKTIAYLRDKFKTLA